MDDKALEAAARIIDPTAWRERERLIDRAEHWDRVACNETQASLAAGHRRRADEVIVASIATARAAIAAYEAETGWRDWTDGNCPVPPDTLVEIQTLVEGKPWDREGSDTAGWFDHLGWWQGTGRVRITAYRLAAAPLPEQETRPALPEEEG